MILFCVNALDNFQTICVSMLLLEGEMNLLLLGRYLLVFFPTGVKLTQVKRPCISSYPPLNIS